ncbi:MAG: hypothetical protein EHM72_03460 [Calditrichaeota bacterium]|nr:MAG: hypothetical protein EHM72_03460 [Calditrichota bacterium]
MIKWNLPLFVWTVTILILTWYPKIEMPDFGFDAQDKIAHFAVFFILGVLACRSFSKYEINRLAFAVTIALKYTLFFAVIDEVVQKYIPGRLFDPYDALFNILGSATSVIFFCKLLMPMVIKRRFLERL